MSYLKITQLLLEVIAKGRILLIWLQKECRKNQTDSDPNLITRAKERVDVWIKTVYMLLEENELSLEYYDLDFTQGLPIFHFGYHEDISNLMNVVRSKTEKLIYIAQSFERNKSRELVILKPDDIDQFINIREITPQDVMEYSRDAFLEDDVEEVILRCLGEPYKELDSGAETRDLYSDRISYNGQRLSTVFLLKGRGLKGRLTIKGTGKNGDQLLKLAKNYSAECFIVQHTNKIESDVRDALQDHVLQNSRLVRVYICFIDGTDTARLLKAYGEDLAALKEKLPNQ